MPDTWKRLESWFEKNAPTVNADLLPGATDKDFAALVKITGAALPDSFKSIYRVHGGQMGIGPPALGEWSLLSIKSIQKEWKLMKGLLDKGVFKAAAVAIGPVQPVWWDAGWIPVGSSGGGDFQCVDLNPASGGQRGQIVTFFHMDEKRERVAASLPALMEAYAGDLEKGRYKLEGGMLVRARKKSS